MNPYKKLKVNRDFSRSLEPHEVFLDRLAQQKEDKIPESENKLEKPLPEKKLWLLLIGVMTIFFLLIARSFWFQIIEGSEYRTRAENNKFIVRVIRAERGVIYDQYMNQLVENKTIYRLMINPEEIPNDIAQKKWLTDRLVQFTELSRLGLEEIIGAREENFLVQDDLTYDQVIFWETKTEDWPGIYLERYLVRAYQQEGGLAHMLGYVSKMDRTGVAGLEKYYDDYLRDRSGEYQIERDARGRIIEGAVIKEPEPGYSLVLNLDYELQKNVESLLRAKMEEVGSREANAIALDPRNGAVLAMVSLPGYDNNIFGKFLSIEELEKIINDSGFSLFNQSISGIGYATGSIIKPLIAVAALEEEIIDPDQEIFAPESICVSHAYTGEQQCYRDWSFHGMTDLRRAISESVNTYFYMIGGGYQSIKGLGPDRIKSWLERFGWGEPTGIDLPNEGQGILPFINQDWRLGNTYHLSIGQGNFSITPLQVAVAYAALANGGILYQPQVVKQVIKKDGKEQEIIMEIDPVILNSAVADYESIEIVREGMRQAVTDPRSSTHALNRLSVSSAVKTGTAQTGREGVYHNWMGIFAPYEDPEIVLILMIRDVAESMIAVRAVAQDILSLYFDHKNDKFNQKDIHD